MSGLVIVALAFVAAWMSIHYFHIYRQEDIASPKTSEKLNKLWDYVNSALRAGRYRASERALLSILKIDHKNTAAYNRLGMLYAKQHNLDDAIECFEIASSLTPTLATLYNLGLVHYEKGNYKQSAAAFEKVIDLEPSPKRYVAYAKVQEKLGNHKEVAKALEKVIEEEPTPKHYELLAQAYVRTKNHAGAEEARKHAAVLQSKQVGASSKPRLMGASRARKIG
jgi:tetratricopeptide (TPR) repeat protein